MWPTTWGSASSTTSALIGLEPAIDGPPVWMVTVIPWRFAQRTMGAASAPVFTEPRPISPTSLTPARAISAKSSSTSPSSRMGAPACIFTPAGRTFCIRLGRDDGERLEADDVLRAARQVHLARRDHGGDPAVEARLDEVHRPLARREVAEDGMAVGVDEARNDRGPRRVDDGVGVAVEAAPHRGDPPIVDRDGVAVEQRKRDVARHDLSDVHDERLH